jgi:hypothetical protein
MNIQNLPWYVYELKIWFLSTMYPAQIYNFLDGVLGTKTHPLSVIACVTITIIDTSENRNVASNIPILQSQKLVACENGHTT